MTEPITDLDAHVLVEDWVPISWRRVTILFSMGCIAAILAVVFIEGQKWVVSLIVGFTLGTISAVGPYMRPSTAPKYQVET